MGFFFSFLFISTGVGIRENETEKKAVPREQEQRAGSKKGTAAVSICPRQIS